MRRPYGFRAYYADDVQPPKRPGDLAIEVRWAARDGRDMEAKLAEQRPDISRVELFQDPDRWRNFTGGVARYPTRGVVCSLSATGATDPKERTMDTKASPIWTVKQGTSVYIFTTEDGRVFTVRKGGIGGWILEDSQGESLSVTTMGRGKAEAHRRYYAS